MATPPPPPPPSAMSAAELQDLQEAAAYVTPIGQDENGKFIYAEEDDAILSILEEQQIRMELANAGTLNKTRQGRESGNDGQQRRPSLLTRVFLRLSSTEQQTQHEEGQRQPQEGQQRVRNDDGKSSGGDGKHDRDRSRRNQDSGGFGNRCWSLGMMTLGTAVLLILLLTIMVVLIHQLSSSSMESPSEHHMDKKGESSSSGGGGGDGDDDGTEAPEPTQISLSTNADTYDYQTDDIIVRFSKRVSYMHDFIGIYQFHEDNEEGRDTTSNNTLGETTEHQQGQDEPLLSLRCCGSQDCFQASGLTGAVRFGAVPTADRLQSWPLPPGLYQVRLYQIRDGERRLTLLTQTMKPFRILESPGAAHSGETPAPAPSSPVVATASLSNPAVAPDIYLSGSSSVVELIGEAADEFEILVNRTAEETAFGDDWIGIYRTSGNYDRNTFLEEVEPNLWLYTCGSQKCFANVTSPAVTFRQNTLRGQAWPLLWGTYQVVLRREYGSVLSLSKASLIIVYPGGLTPVVYSDKDEYKVGETIAIYFNDGKRDLPGVYSASGQRGGGTQTGGGSGSVGGGGGGGRGGSAAGGGRGSGSGGSGSKDRQPLEWVAIYEETDSITSDAPVVFLYTCLPPKDCTGLRAVPYQGRILFESGENENPVALSSYGTWPLRVGRYKAALNRGAFPSEFLSGNVTRSSTTVGMITSSLRVFRVVE